jgi:hypothetical protein
MSISIEDMPIEDVKHLRDFLIDIDKDSGLSKRSVPLVEALDKALQLSNLSIAVHRIEHFSNLALKDSEVAISACDHKSDYYDQLVCINTELKNALIKVGAIKYSLKRDIYEV